MTIRKIDPRVIRTRTMLREALVALILEGGFDSITIADITERAGLRRATFYLHYRDKEELLLTMLREMIEALVGQIDKMPDHSVGSEVKNREQEYRVFLMTFQFAQTNGDLFRAIVRGQGANVVIRYIRDYLISDMQARIPTSDLNGVPVAVLANFLASARLNMAVWWLEGGMVYSPEQMAELCSRLTFDGLRGIFEPPTSPVIP